MMVPGQDTGNLCHWRKASAGENSAGDQAADGQVPFEDGVYTEDYDGNRAYLLHRLCDIYGGERQKPGFERKLCNSGIN